MDSWFVEMGGAYKINGERIFGRNVITVPEKIDSLRSRFDNQDVYATAYRYQGENQDNSLLYGDFYIDLDININGDEDFVKVQRDLKFVLLSLSNRYKVPPEYIKVYYSGHKGFHIIVPAEVLGIEPCHDLNVRYKALANEIKTDTLFKSIDTKIYDRKRLLRLPNSINGKTGLYKVPVDHEFAITCKYQEMKDYAKNTHEMQYAEPKFCDEAFQKFNQLVEKSNVTEFRPRKDGKFVPLKGIPPCAEKIMEQGVTEGRRNQTASILASCLMQMNNGVQETIDTLLDWNERNNPRLDEGEIVRTVKSVANSFTSGKRYGCASIKEMGFCVPAKCKFAKKVR